jgi:hypothetical protein
MEDVMKMGDNKSAESNDWNPSKQMSRSVKYFKPII